MNKPSIEEGKDRTSQQRHEWARTLATVIGNLARVAIELVRS